jgi:hypothetical protein
LLVVRVHDNTPFHDFYRDIRMGKEKVAGQFGMDWVGFLPSRKRQ